MYVRMSSKAKAARGRRHREPGACVPAATSCSPAIGHHADITEKAVRRAVNDRGLFIADWFGVREKYYFSWKFTIVYDQANIQTN